MTNTSFAVEFVNANQLASVNAISNTFRKGASVQVTTFKSADDYMKKGTKNNRNPFLGRVFVKSVIGGWVVGTNYKASCDAAADRSGSDAEFKAKASWHTYYNDFFEVNKKDPNKFYLQLQRSEMTGNKSEHIYYLDGHVANDAEEKAIKAWYKASGENKMSSSQVEAGITADRERHYKVLSLDSIVEIKQGAVSYKCAVVKALAEVER